MEQVCSLELFMITSLQALIQTLYFMPLTIQIQKNIGKTETIQLHQNVNCLEETHTILHINCKEISLIASFMEEESKSDIISKNKLNNKRP